LIHVGIQESGKRFPQSLLRWMVVVCISVRFPTTSPAERKQAAMLAGTIVVKLAREFTGANQGMGTFGSVRIVNAASERFFGVAQFLQPGGYGPNVKILALMGGTSKRKLFVSKLPLLMNAS
jgi:hypothetical protein